MGGLLGLHEISIAGDSVSITTTGSSQSTELLSDPNKNGPARFLLLSTESVYVRQGDSTVTVATTDMRIPADQPFVITVTSIKDSYIAVRQVDTAGTFRATRISHVDDLP